MKKGSRVFYAGTEWKLVGRHKGKLVLRSPNKNIDDILVNYQAVKPWKEHNND